MTRGFWRMHCWNGLSAEQQQRLIEVGNLAFPWAPEGECKNPASVAIETEDDAAPGPRFYCDPCAADYLAARRCPACGAEGGRCPNGVGGLPSCIAG